MNPIIIGIDKELQDFDQRLKDLIAHLTESEQVTLIGEEHLPASLSVAQQVAQSRGISWIQIDMDTGERIAAGIYDKLFNRTQIRGYDEHGMPIQAIRYAVKEDGVREELWLDRIAEHQAQGTALLICGALHARPLVKKAQQKGHDTSLRFFPENPGSQFWVSITPELF